MNQKPTYSGQKTRSAEAFDNARPYLGSGGNTLKQLREVTPDPALIDAVWHLASHMGGLATALEKQTGLVRYSSVNPPEIWGRATKLARDAMQLNPQQIVTSKRIV